MKKGKIYRESAKLVDKTKSYDPLEAANLVLLTAKAKFDETIELHVRLGVDPRHADQQVRGTINLPHGTGRKVRILVITKGDKADDALKAGADIVGAEEMIAKIQTEGFLAFDVCIATPDMMGQLGRVAKILGPKGLMPNPKSGTVTNDITKTVTDMKAGRSVEYRLDKTAIIHCPVGRKSFGADKIAENFTALLDAIQKAKPSAAKGVYMKSIYMASTMGPGVKVVYKP